MNKNHHRNNEDDCMLWSQLKSGDKEALGTIFKEQYDDLYNYGLKLIKNEDFVRDAIQDLFIKLWISKNNLKDLGVIKPYLIRAFRNLLIDQTRTFHRVPEISISEINENLFFDIVDFRTDSTFEQEQISKLIGLLNNLPPRVKEALYLRFFIGLDFNELPEVMNVSVQSVRNLISQGIKLLREQFIVLIILLIT